MKTAAVPHVSAPNVVATSRVPVSTAPPTPISLPSAPSGVLITPIAAFVAAAKDAGKGGRGGNQMTPDAAKHKAKNLDWLLRMVKCQPPPLAENVRNLIQSLVDGVVDPDTFSTKLEHELKLLPHLCPVPFLKQSLPFLQTSLLSGELSLDGIRPPTKTRTRAMTTIGGPGGIARNVMEVRPPTVVAPSWVSRSTVAPTPTPLPSAPSDPRITLIAASAADAKGMTPEAAKHKTFLASLQLVRAKQTPPVAENLRNLIQGLIDGVVDPETFTTKLQHEYNLPPQPRLVPYLKHSLLFLQTSLLSGELSIDGIQPGIWINQDLL